MRIILAIFLLFIGSNFALGEEICRCPAVLDEVCGSDGETYPNKCEMECVQKTNPELTIAYDGPC